MTAIVVTLAAPLPAGTRLLVRQYDTGEVEADVKLDGDRVWTPLQLRQAGATAEVAP